MILGPKITHFPRFGNDKNFVKNKKTVNFIHLNAFHREQFQKI